jgi:uncharacterized membrane protein
MQARTWRSVVYFAAGLGLVVSLFAAAEFFDAALRSICSVSAFFSCSAVDQSGRTSTLGVPDWAWGVFGFVAILGVGGLAERRPTSTGWAWGLVGLTSAGVALSLYLLYVELALIGALCLVCASAYVLGAIAWIGALGTARHVAEDAAHADDDGAASAPGPD